MTETKEVYIAQANAITQGRYNFTVVEKRAVYFIIKEVRKQFIDNPNGQKTLFENLVIKMQTKDLQSSDTQLDKVYKSLITLRKKSIFINNDKEALELGYINYFHHIKHEPFLEVEVSKKILPYLVELADNFTEYRLTVAIALQTKYAQRFYEYCSQYSYSGFFTLTPTELTEKLDLGNKYPRWALLKSKVIDVAHKELKDLYAKGECDSFFEYSVVKRGRSVERIKFVVISRIENKEKPKLDDLIFQLRAWLTDWLSANKRPKNKAWINNVIKQLQLKPDNIAVLHKRLLDMQRLEANTSYAALSRHIIEEDFLNE